MKVKIINKSRHPLPEYKTEGAAGVDLYANLQTPILLNPLERQLVPTGIFLEIPAGYEAQIRPRSGLAFKNGIGVLNSPGTIDSDYRGEIKVIVINLSNDLMQIADGERVAQMVFAPYEQAQWVETDELSDTERGQGGFGSTGKK